MTFRDYIRGRKGSDKQEGFSQKEEPSAQSPPPPPERPFKELLSENTEAQRITQAAVNDFFVMVGDLVSQVRDLIEPVKDNMSEITRIREEHITDISALANDVQGVLQVLQGQRPEVNPKENQMTHGQLLEWVQNTPPPKDSEVRKAIEAYGKTPRTGSDAQRRQQLVQNLRYRDPGEEALYSPPGARDTTRRIQTVVVSEKKSEVDEFLNTFLKVITFGWYKKGN
jgi:hypothetical protein